MKKIYLAKRLKELPVTDLRHVVDYINQSRIKQFREYLRKKIYIADDWLPNEKIKSEK